MVNMTTEQLNELIDKWWKTEPRWQRELEAKTFLRSMLTADNLKIMKHVITDNLKKIADGE